MTHALPPGVSRRGLLTAAGALALCPTASLAVPREMRLRAAPDTVQLVPTPHPPTDVWAFDGQVPGREIRARQGDRIRIALENGLAEETTVHWHGLRVPNDMDGVPHLTQPPVPAGGRHVYEFGLPDAGTYWYHPHTRGSEQVGRGLYGAFIVEETEPPAVDRDMVWVLDDWRLLDSAQISGDFGNFGDMSHAGRLGNSVTVNGAMPETLPVRAGERIRLRLINAANARVFALRFEGLAPRIIALDGQPVEPHAPPGGRIVLGPAMRADLILDITGKPGDRHAVIDGFYPRQTYKLLDLVCGEERLREEPPADPIALASNPLAEPDVAGARRHVVTFEGGMMSRLGGAKLRGEYRDIRALMRQGLAWAVNGVVAHGHVLDPIVTLERGSSYVLELRNDTSWWHPIHLHGHSFRVIARDGRPTALREWRDTVLMAPRERVDIAFVADNPGDWMFHCHILEHQEAGMMGVVRVA